MADDDEGPIELPEQLEKGINEDIANDIRKFVKVAIDFIDARSKFAQFILYHWETYSAFMKDQKVIKNILELYLPTELGKQAKLARQYHTWPIEDVPEEIRNDVMFARSIKRSQIKNKITSIFKLLRPLYPPTEVQAYDNLEEMLKTKKTNEKKARQEAKLLKSNDSKDGT